MKDQKPQKDPRDPKRIGIPNINFSTYSEGDRREKEFLKQRLDRGFDESETWQLYQTISGFICPRLRAFKIVNQCHPPEMTPEKWDEIIDKMIKSFELVNKSDFLSEQEADEIREGLNLFTEYFFALWW